MLGSSGREKRKCQKPFESRTKSPWTSQFMTLDLHMEFVSTAWPFELLSVNQARLSECGELNWCECLHKGTDDSRGGNANDLYGQ